MERPLTFSGWHLTKNCYNRLSALHWSAVHDSPGASDSESRISFAQGGYCSGGATATLPTRISRSLRRVSTILWMLGGADELSSDGSLSEEEESEVVPSEEPEVGSGSDPDGFWDFL